jgi:NADH dehydrogenase [ubiquinone] 1 alpha subcomplex assembly factor 7
MNSLSKYFLSSKKIPIDKFISNVLYNKKHGYYSKKNPFGKSGDFITSPGISSLFSEMIALWTISLWEHLGKPKVFNIIELGPGDGQMCATLVRIFKKFPVFYNSANFFLYEKSKILENLQKKKLVGNRINWIRNFDKIKKGPVIFLGNEFFDAIPIKQFKKINNVLYEKYVKLENNSKVVPFFKKIDPKILIELKKYDLFKKQSFIEFPKQGLTELNLIINSVKKLNGGLLLIDYGFLKQEGKNTLQSIKNHKQNIIFDNVGNADITSLVDFNLLKKHLKKKKLEVNNIVTQEFFLKKMGIIDRADMVSQKMNFKEKSNLYLRLQRLLNSKQMGGLFKVISAFKLKKKFSLGFN